MLTAADVEQKTFSTALRGYDLDEVDDFLDEVVTTIRGLNEQLEEARAGGGPVVTPVPVTKAEPEPEPEPTPSPEPMAADAPAIDESAIGRALVAAQTAADRLLDDAQTEATRIVDEAKQEADNWEEQKEAKRIEAETEMAGLTSRVAAVRSELSVLADAVATNLDEMDSVIAGRHAGAAEDSAGGEIEDSTTGTVEDESADESGPANGSDHLDAILTGVATDLRLTSDDADGETDEDEEEVWGRTSSEEE
jgi:DivIVA domain-containing protein